MATAMSYSKDAAAPPVRKKLKTSEIPIGRDTRKVIEDLTHKFKKKGGYDSLRKQVWDDLQKSDFEAEFTQSLDNIADAELERNPGSLLKPSRDKAAVLLEGVAQRAGVYQTAETRIDALIDTHIEKIEAGIRDLRRADIGEVAAAAEEAKGGKTDEQYEEDRRQKRETREKVRQDARDKERAEADEKRREDRAKRKEEERILEAEREKRHADREARRRAEREREEEKERELRERDRGRDRDRERDDRQGSRFDQAPSRRDSTRETKEPAPKIELSKEETERLEQEALNDLLKEGERVARQSRPRHQMEMVFDETLAPPPRKSMPSSAITPISRDSPVKTEVKKPFAPPTGPKNSGDGFKTPRLPVDKDNEDDRTRDRRRSRSRDRASRRSSRSRSRHRRDSRDRDTVRSRRDSRERDKDSRRRHDSRDRDDRHKDDRRRRSRDRDDRRTSYRSRSRSRERPDRAKEERARSRDRVRAASPPLRTSSLEQWKLSEAKKREQEAKAYLELRKEALAKGLPVPGWHDTTQADATPKPTSKEDGQVSSPPSARKRDGSRDRDRDRDRRRTRSRSITDRRGSRAKQRSTSPVNIDRYVPGASSRSRRDSTTVRSPSRKNRSRSRDRDRDRDREKDSRRSRDDDRTRRRSRSRSRRRDRSRDRGRTKARSRSPYARRERDSRRERSRSHDKDRRRERSRSRDKDRERDRDRKRDRSKESRRDSRRD